MPYQPAVLGSARLNNFRLDYLTAEQAADRPTHVRILLDGLDLTAPGAPIRVLFKSLSIKDLVFDAPNTCTLTLYGAAPRVGQRLEIWISVDPAVLLFAGELQTVNRTYAGRPTTVLHPCTAIDDTARANRKRPLGLFTNTSATAIAEWLITTYAPGYSTAGVEPNLPPVSINFDGSEAGMKGCLTAIAKLIGGYWFFENRTLFLFLTPPGPAPDPIDDTPNRFLHEPAIKSTVDKSQVRTRVYGKGASTRIVAALDAGASTVPVENAEMFNPAGGQAIAGISPDGAASRILTYTGAQLGGGGGLVGPGAAPSAAPTVAAVAGAGIEAGIHRYAYTFVTAVGESTPSPVATVDVGLTAAPAAPAVGAALPGGAIESGSHTYAVTFVTATGETTGSGPSAAVSTIAAVSLPTARPSPFGGAQGHGANQLDADAYYAWRYSFYRPGDGAETAPSEATTGPYFNGAAQIPTGYVGASNLSLGPGTPPAGYVVRWYRSHGHPNNAAAMAAPMYLVTGGSTAGGYFYDGSADSSLGALAPTGDTTGSQSVPLSGIAIGPAAVTARKIYRSSNGAPYQLVDTIANNTTTTYTDTKAAASLGAVMPATNTATANQVAATVAIGGAAVTARKIYRTAAGASALKLLTTIANNTTTTHTDAAPDSSLGADAPLGDTSGLTQPSGQVPAGSTSLIVANAAPFAASGGWAIVGNGDQVIRYSGKTATQLTGIPPTGSGAIIASVSYNSTVTAAAALVGVTGILEAVIRHAPILVWVQRDDLAAQAYMASLDGTGDGIYEHIVRDERRSEASLRQVCDAELALYSRPLVTVLYATRDLKTKSGKTVEIAVSSPAIAESLTIQDVTITEIGIAKRLAPKFTVTASTVHHTLEAILRDLIRKAEA